MTDVVTRAEHAELLSSIRALRAENSRLEARLDRIEAEKKENKVVVSRAAPATTGQPISSTRASSSADALPPLTVVKLKPKKEAAPKLETVVEVSEPPESITQELREKAQERAEREDDAKDAPPDDADLSMAEAQYERGLESMKTGNSEAGIAQMQQFVTDWPRHPKADNALYLAGTSFFAAKDYEHALPLFERVISQYPAGDALLDSMLKLAECRLKVKGPREARATWEKIISGYPGTSAASQAQARLHASQTSAASP